MQHGFALKLEPDLLLCDEYVFMSRQICDHIKQTLQAIEQAMRESRHAQKAGKCKQ